VDNVRFNVLENLKKEYLDRVEVEVFALNLLLVQWTDE